MNALLIPKILVWILLYAWQARSLSFNIVKINALSPNGTNAFTNSRNVEICASLAVQHFNDRRVDLYPALKIVEKCSIKINVTAYCDDQAKSLVGVNLFTNLIPQLDAPIHAVSGLVVSGVAASITVLSSALGTWPVMSHWAQNPILSSKSLYPRFARTIESSTATSEILALLLKKLKYKKVALLYSSQEFGTGFKDALFAFLSRENIGLTFISMIDDDETSIQTALHALEQTKLNVVITVMQSGNSLPTFARLVNAHPSVNSTAKLWILPTLTGNMAIHNFIRSDFQTAKFFSGVWTLQVSTDNVLFNNFMDNHWSTGNLSASDVNHILPPFVRRKGNATTVSTCLNSQPGLDMHINQSYFSRTTARSRQIQMAYAYDAIMVLAIAACSLDNGTTIPTGNDLYARILATDFEGFSGHLRFDAYGDRIASSLNYELIQFVDVKGVANASDFETRTLGTMKEKLWTLRLEHALFKDRTKALPLEEAPPPQEYNYLSQPLKNWGYAQTAILLFLSLASMLFTVVNRANPVMIYSNVDMMLVFAFGIFITSFVPMLLTADDNPSDPLNQALCCQLSPILYAVGFTVANGALVVKLNRLHQVFFNKSMKRKAYCFSSKALMLIGLLLVFAVALLFLWGFLTPLLYVRIVTVWWNDQYPINSYGSCRANADSIWILICFFVIYTVVLVMLLVAAFSVRTLPSKYQESTYIGISILLTFQLYLIGLPSIVAFQGNTNGIFVVMSLIVFLNAVVLLGMLFIPKIIRVYKLSVFDSSVGESNSYNNRKWERENPRVGLKQARESNDGCEERELDLLQNKLDFLFRKSVLDINRDNVRPPHDVMGVPLPLYSTSFENRNNVANAFHNIPPPAPNVEFSSNTNSGANALFPLPVGSVTNAFAMSQQQLTSPDEFVFRVDSSNRTAKLWLTFNEEEKKELTAVVLETLQKINEKKQVEQSEEDGVVINV